MIKLSTFDEAFARWRGEAPEVGPGKSPIAIDHDFDKAFAEWEDVSFDQLVDQMSAALVSDAEIDFEDIVTEELPTTRLRRAS